MAENDAKLVRRAYEAWNSEGVDALAPWLADDVELEDAPELPDAAAWRGRAAVLGRLRDVAEAVGGGSADLREFRDLGEEVLVSLVWQTGDQADSPAFGDVFHLVRVTDGRIARVRVFLRESAALEKAGTA
jgi:ketosteroid isomerase-like protein